MKQGMGLSDGRDGLEWFQRDKGLKNELTLRDEDGGTLHEAGLPAAIKGNSGRWMGENMTKLRRAIIVNQTQEYGGTADIAWECVSENVSFILKSPSSQFCILHIEDFNKNLLICTELK